jgi:hypothetical protein
MNETFRPARMGRLRCALTALGLALLLALPVGSVEAQKKPAKTVFTADEIMAPMDQIGPQDWPLDLGTYAHVLHMAPGEKHPTVAAALAAVQDAAPAKRYAILVAAGTYNGDLMGAENAFWFLAKPVLLLVLKASMALPPGMAYNIDQETCDRIQDDMTEAQVSRVLGGGPHAAWDTVFSAPFSRKAMPVTLKQWWGEKSLIEVHFDGNSKTVFYKRIINGTDHRFARPSFLNRFWRYVPN